MQYDPLFDPMAIHTKRLTLRPARMRDAHDVFEYSKDPEVAKHVLWDAHQSMRETRAVLRHMIRDYRYAPPFTYVIELKEERPGDRHHRADELQPHQPFRRGGLPA